MKVSTERLEHGNITELTRRTKQIISQFCICNVNQRPKDTMLYFDFKSFLTGLTCKSIGSMLAEVGMSPSGCCGYLAILVVLKVSMPRQTGLPCLPGTEQAVQRHYLFFHCSVPGAQSIIYCFSIGCKFFLRPVKCQERC